MTADTAVTSTVIVVIVTVIVHSNPSKTDTYGTEITVLYIEMSPTQGVGGTLHETGHTHKIMRGNHISSFRHLDSPADSVKDRMTINKVVLMIEQVDFEKMSRHHIQWLLACNLLS